MVLRVLEHLADWWIGHRWQDLVITALGLSALLIPHHELVVGNFAMGVATVGGVLLGMAAVVVTIYLGGRGVRFSTLRALQGAEMRRNWFGILLGFVTACIMSIVSLALVWMPSVAIAITGVSAALLVAKSWRMVMLLHSIMTIADLDALQEAGGPPRRELSRSRG